jgi:hypothetical protein
MSDSPSVECECGKRMKKVFHACGIVVAGGLSKSRVLDSMKREGEMRAELKHDYGIEKFAPIGRNTTADVYRDVKGSGTFVKDQMALETERNNERRDAKMKDWKAKAQRRASKRREEMRQRKEAEAAAKRRITVTTGNG